MFIVLEGFTCVLKLSGEVVLLHFIEEGVEIQRN